MDEILRSQEMAEIDEVLKEAFSYENPVLYFPIRHHSPACAFHLKKVIKEYEPECILIEGPSGANELLDLMAHEETCTPFAVYYSYRDSKGYINNEKEDYKCYYPYLDYSPELVAVREGIKHKLAVEFIDLPYSEILIASTEGKGLLKKAEKNNYNDDYLLSRNNYIEELLRKADIRSFDEFWEKYFEMNAMAEDTKTYVRHMLAYCVLSRLHSSEEELAAEGCFSREAYMAYKIFEKEKIYKKILVVTGGFHTPGLIKLRQDTEKEKDSVKLHSMDKDMEGVYLMPYSMEACDSLNGYSSGMPYPGFYQDIYKEYEKQNEKAYEETILKYIVSAGKEARKKEGYISSYDEICAYSMVQGLALLRGKTAPGVYDLMDSILSSFIKGEYNLSTNGPIRIVKKQLTGSSIGRLCKDAKVPPLVQHFESLCKKYRLNIRSTLSSEITLAIFSTERHRRVSEFFYQMEFLNTQFGRKVKGPDLRMKRDRNLMRETWKYKWSSQVVAALIDMSVYGGTLLEACTTIAFRRIQEDINSKEGTLLLTRMYEMGMTEQLPKLLYHLEGVLKKDSDFFSLVEAMSNFLMLEELNSLYLTRFDFKDLIQTAYEKILHLLPFMASLKEEDLPSSMTALKTMYQLLQRKEYEENKEVFYEALITLLKQDNLQTGLEGCIRGILYGSGHCTFSDIEKVCYGYMSGTHEKLLSGAKLFRGLFFTARDLVFVGSSFIKMMDEFIGSVTGEDFMLLLPELRIAFSYFTPREIDEIANKVAMYHGREGKDIAIMAEISPLTYEYGKALNEMVLQKM
ncbi:hypothetical protein acsn021_18430 [Anaerocolumna cellulosilytica]|uniref:Uncharacterized protein n=1 Tax=Anaerocolumna cellulosilytica TaxID=433286 RepID=A0A6S6QUG6_9FIRM|nr:DUF5682 family protein [Anaerocolumna cellulosilytica]MBB5194763.1 hypothetical protein [Anaerocolumna cellulosilytica]BCJ94274.1 hypothetical protein acsn021_18430 [Anaerocolumna cellulosilytica]